VTLVRIFHLNDPFFGAARDLPLELETSASVSALFRLAGVVVVPVLAGQLTALHAAWEKAQNLEEAWGDGRQRSSMVGDVFEVGGTFYRVASIGFDPLSEAEQAAFTAAFGEADEEMEAIGVPFDVFAKALREHPE
jgi:hypothetical protein